MFKDDEMKMLSLFSGLLVILACLSGGCCSQCYRGGDVITLKAGETKTIILQENMTTGYQWEIISPESPVYSVEFNEHIQPENADGRVGAPGIRRIVIKGEDAGKARLAIELRRPWEKDGNAADGSAVTIEVLK